MRGAVRAAVANVRDWPSHKNCSHYTNLKFRVPAPRWKQLRATGAGVSGAPGNFAREPALPPIGASRRRLRADPLQSPRPLPRAAGAPWGGAGRPGAHGASRWRAPGRRISLEGVVITRYGPGCRRAHPHLEACHPVPDEHGEAAARENSRSPGLARTPAPRAARASARRAVACRRRRLDARPKYVTSIAGEWRADNTMNTVGKPFGNPGGNLAIATVPLVGPIISDVTATIHPYRSARAPRSVDVCEASRSPARPCTAPRSSPRTACAPRGAWSETPKRAIPASSLSRIASSHAPGSLSQPPISRDARDGADCVGEASRGIPRSQCIAAARARDSIAWLAGEARLLSLGARHVPSRQGRGGRWREFLRRSPLDGGHGDTWAPAGRYDGTTVARTTRARLLRDSCACAL